LKGTITVHPENEYAVAARRARKKLAFYFHFFIYLIVNILLLTINLIQGGKLWFFYPLLGWLLGILIHAFFTFSNLHARCWRKMVEKEINALEKSKNIRR